MTERSEGALVKQYVAAGLLAVTAQQIAEETMRHDDDARMAAPFGEDIARQMREGVTNTINELGLEA